MGCAKGFGLDICKDIRTGVLKAVRKFVREGVRKGGRKCVTRNIYKYVKYVEVNKCL